MLIILFYNSKSGTLLNSPELIESATKLIKSKASASDKIETFDVQQVEVDKIIREKELTIDDRIIIAGGDGTISSIINSTIDYRVPVGVLPLGTFNNFSKTLKLSQDLNKAIDQIISGEVIDVDVVKLNGRVVINNSSIGVYPKLVSVREDSQNEFNIGKPTAMIIALLKAALLFPLIKVQLKSDEIEIRVKTPFVMISNNRYNLTLNGIGERKNLNEGFLYVYLVKCKSRICVLKVLLKALFGSIDDEMDFELLASKKAEITLGKKEVEVAADGEVFKVVQPLRYQVCTGCLKVVVPDEYE